MLRKLVIGVLLLGTVWTGLWFGIAAATRAGLDNWSDLRRAEGWHVEMTSRQQSGFPLDIHTHIDGLTLERPRTATRIEIPDIEIRSALMKPLSPEIHLPAQTLVIANSVSRATLELEQAKGFLSFHPTPMLELEEAGFVLAPWQVSGPNGPLLMAQGALAEMAQDSADPTVYHFEITAEALRPAAALTEAVSRASDLPEAFDAFLGQMTVAFDRPFDRRSQPRDRPQPRRIDLRRANVKWGAIDLAAEAELAVDQNGLPEGTLSLSARNWMRILDLVEAAGLLDLELRRQIENTLGIVARMNGDEDSIDVEITFAGGRMSLGMFPLGPAPRLYLQ